MTAITQGSDLQDISTRSDGNPKKILVVEDAVEGRQLMTAKLEKLGHTVTAVSSPEQAATYVGMRRFDLIVIEIRPEHQRDIVAMVSQVKAALPAKPTVTPILAIAEVTPGGRVHTALLGMVDYYIMAPYHTVELQRTIARALDAHPK
jgi:CheY-like chemotaxis protein